MTRVETWRGLRARLRARGRALPTWSHEVGSDGQGRRYIPLLVVAGVLVVCAGYAFGREHRPGAEPLYWSGQLLILAPIVLGIFDRRSGEQHRTHLLVVLAGCQSFLAWAYSPLRFTFPDELQHLRTATDIVQTGHLFTPNTYLPVSPGFPGLEIVTTCVCSVTGLSLPLSGLLVASLGHVLLTAAVLGLYSAVLGPGRASSLAGLVYAANPHASYFNTLFVYTALALPFLVLALRLALTQHRRRVARIAALLPLGVAVVTHHLTALFGTAMLVAFALVQLIIDRARRTDNLAVLVVGLNGLVLALAWTSLASPETFDYLGRPLAALGRALTQQGGSDSLPPLAPPPRWESAVSATSVLVTVGLLAAGALLLRRRTAGPRLPLAFAVLALVYPGVLVVRMVATDGAELATRALTYVMLLVAVPAGVALASLTADPSRRGRKLVAVGLAVLLLAGGITIGLPPWWERVPGRFRVDAFEAGHDLSVEVAGRWAAGHLPRDAKVASDLTLGGVLASYAAADLATDASPAFYAGTVTGERAVVSRLSLSYVFVDRRITQQTPITGGYFPNDVLEGRHVGPVPARDLRPFDARPQLIVTSRQRASVQAGPPRSVLMTQCCNLLLPPVLLLLFDLLPGSSAGLRAARVVVGLPVVLLLPGHLALTGLNRRRSGAPGLADAVTVSVGLLVVSGLLMDLIGIPLGRVEWATVVALLCLAASVHMFVGRSDLKRCQFSG